MPLETYTITLERPAGVSVPRMKGYIKEAVMFWGNSFEPPRPENEFEGDPLFGTKTCIVKRAQS